MSVRLEPGHDDRGRRAKAAIRLAADPHGAKTVEEDVYDASLDPAGESLIAWDGEVAVGAGEVCRMAISGEAYERLWARIWVVPERRREGVATQLLARLREHAGMRGKTGFETEVSTDDPGGLAFALARGFAEDWREQVLRLPLPGRAAPARSGAGPPVAGQTPSVRVLDPSRESLAGVHAIASEALADVPGGTMPMAAGDLSWWRRVWIDPPAARAGRLFVAELDGEIAGYALLALPPARPGVGFHAITAVARAARGRGVAGALKQAQIAWAIEQGLDQLETHNERTNEAMLAVNLRLGYEPVCDLVGLVSNELGQSDLP